MILADTSIWVSHLRRPNPQLEEHLRNGRIIMHPFIVAEIALGSLRNRKRVLGSMDAIYAIKVARQDEVRQLIEAHALYSKGIGLTDAHLIASCLITGTQLWTADGAMKKAAAALGMSVHP